MAFKITTLLAVAATAAALDLSHWAPASPSDSRSPCPGLNTLANYGVIPSSGKGVTVPVLTKGLEQAYSLEPSLAAVLAIGALLSSSNPLGLSFELADLDLHNYIEHDGSLSRKDFNQGGNDWTFSEPIFDSYLAHYDGANTTTIASAAHGRLARVTNASRSDPDFFYGPTQFLLSYAETALLLQCLNNNNPNVPVSWLPTFFDQGELPVSQGWKPPAQEVTWVSTNKLIAQMISDSGDGIPDGLIITESTLAKAFLGMKDLEGAVSALAQELLNKYGLGGSGLF